MNFLVDKNEYKLKRWGKLVKRILKNSYFLIFLYLMLGIRRVLIKIY